MTTIAKPGDIRTWDFQSDVFGGEYRLIENLGGNLWEAENVEPSDALLDAIADYYVDGVYTGYVDPFGPGRRIATPAEAADAEIDRRIARTGERFQVRLVSAAEFAIHF